MSNNTISGNGRPTDRTIGNVGDIYMDSVSGNKYKCVGTRKVVTDTVSIYYIWVRYGVAPDSPTTPTTNGQYVDESTGRIYTLSVNNGKLTMGEV